MTIAMLCIVTALFIFLEVKKKRSYQALRILAIGIMMLSVAGIMLRPRYVTISSDSVLLLTPGYSADHVDSIMRENPGLSVMHLANTKSYASSELLHGRDITKIKIDWVVGEGLTLYDLDKVNDATFNYIPSPLPEGFIELNFDADYQPHRKGSITGIYNNSGGKTMITLMGPSDREDSVTIHQKGQNHFSLSFVPLQPGTFTYSLIVRDSAKLTREILPIHVSDVRTLEILFLQYYPTFETQYLKSYLAKNNHRMTLRYQLSKSNFRHEFINREGGQATRLSDQLLSEFDLLIADAPSLAMLSSQEKSIIERSVRSGLGLLTLPPIGQRQTDFFPFETVATTDTTTVMLHQKPFLLPASPMRVKNDQKVVPLLSNRSGVLNGYTFQHAGKIGFQLLNETFRLWLAGDSLAYSEMWAPLIEKIARRKQENAKVKIVSPFPWYEDEPLEIEIISSNENIILMDDSTQLPLRESLKLDNVWHGRTWASKKGWHILKTNEATVKPYFIQSRPEWHSLSIANQIRINGLRNAGNNRNKVEIASLKDVPPIIFYLTLLAAAGFVWLSPRL